MRCGFIINWEFHQNSSIYVNHEENATKIIEKNGWQSEYKQFKDTAKDDSTQTAKDFLILEKGAIQVGLSGGAYIVYSAKKIPETEIDMITSVFGLKTFKKILYWEKSDEGTIPTLLFSF